MAGIIGALPGAVAGTVCGGEGIDDSRLRDQGFLVFAGIAAVLIEMGDEAAMGFVFAALQPKGEKLVGQMPFGLCAQSQDVFGIQGGASLRLGF